MAGADEWIHEQPSNPRAAILWRLEQVWESNPDLSLRQLLLRLDGHGRVPGDARLYEMLEGMRARRKMKL